MKDLHTKTLPNVRVAFFYHLPSTIYSLQKERPPQLDRLGLSGAVVVLAAHQVGCGRRVLLGRLLVWNEPGGGAVAAARVADTASVEPEAAVVEVEARRALEVAVGVPGVLVPGAVDPQVVVVVQTLGVGEQHDGHLEGSHAELLCLHHRASTADGATPMADAELSGDHQDVVSFLRACDPLQRFGLLEALTQPIWSELPLAVIHELAVAGRAKHLKHALERLAVGLSERLPARDGEPSLGARGHRCARDLLVAGLELGEVLAQDGHLLGDGLGSPVAGLVAIVALDLFVGEVLS